MRARLVPCLTVLLLSTLSSPATVLALPHDGPPPADAGRAVDYLILTSDQLAHEFQAFADFKQRHDGFAAEVHTLSEVRAAIPTAVDDVERIRQFLIQYRDQHGTRFVLLGGDVSVVPARIEHADDAWRSQFEPQPSDVASDLVFVSPDGDWDSNHDGLFGTTADAVVLQPTLAVGRAPVRDAEEARRFVAKTERYEDGVGGAHASPGAGAGQDRRGTAPDVLLAAGDGAYFRSFPTEAAEYIGSRIATFATLGIARLYDSETPIAGAGALTEASWLGALDEGADLVVAVAPSGTPDRLEFLQPADGPAPSLDVGQALALENHRQPFTFFTIMNINTPGIPGTAGTVGEALVRAPRGGAVAAMAPASTELVSEILQLQEQMIFHLYDGTAPALGNALNLAIADVAPQYQIIGFPPSLRAQVLLGDPSLRLRSATAARGATRPAATPLPLAALPPGRELTTGVTRPVTRTAGAGLQADAGRQAADLVFAAPRRASSGATLEWSVSVPARLAGQPMELALFDVSGRRVGGISGAIARAGANVLRWAPREPGASAAGPGLYFARLRVAQVSRVQRVFLAP
ncbi:MAG TPA: C25 family cysteine peptidase [Candidatus Eisenbacteria bacterium]|jgi:hypothetical protein